MNVVGYEFTHFNNYNDKTTITGANGTPANIKEIIDNLAESNVKRWKRKFMKWAAEMPKWGYDMKKNLRLRQNGYDKDYHRMKRPQDFAEEPTLTQQGVPDLFQLESEDELEDEEDFDTWEIT